jgi:ACS family pantothenate transporter-like MFS transporter
MSISTVRSLSPITSHKTPLTTSFPQFFGLFSSLCLAIWNIPTTLHWFAYFISRAAVPYGPLSMSWANEICGADAEERAVVLGVMNASGYAVNAWLPLLTYPVVEAPRFKRGFCFSVGAFGVQFFVTGLVAWLWRWEKRGAVVKGEEYGDRESVVGLVGGA